MFSFLYFLSLYFHPPELMSFDCSFFVIICFICCLCVPLPGAPPDMFDPNGQNWGFPTYNWEVMAQDGYTW
jgi:4-alpha-glucanotransferase